MYEIRNYLKKPDTIIVDPVKINEQNINDYFIELNDQATMRDVKEMLDSQYLEGALVLNWNGHTIFDLSQWDLIDQLWAYILNLFEEYLEKGESSILFPDQPIEIKMKKDNSRIILSVEDSVIQVPEIEFIRCMINEADVFFKTLMKYQLGNYENELEQVERISWMIHLNQ